MQQQNVCTWSIFYNQCFLCFRVGWNNTICGRYNKNSDGL